MLKLLGTITLIMLAFFAAKEAGWLTEAQAQYVPPLNEAIPPALAPDVIAEDDISPSIPSKLTDRVAGEK